MKNLPIGIQTLSKIIEGGFVYVDKTEIAYNLIQNAGYYFLSRPRRFGKSLFLDTLKEIFEGNKELFKGLYIYDKWDWEVKYPVLRVSLGSGVIKTIEKLQHQLKSVLGDIEEDLVIECKKSLNVKDCFKYLIKESFKKYNQKVVILIDEYDKPILDNITDKDIARQMRDAMKDFYGVIKDNDAYIQFVFITGVSKFSKMNLFSGLNNLEDITLHQDYGNICGYTHNDLLTVFKEHLEGVDMERVKQWYNGYNFFGDKVYNPFDILLFISNKFIYKSYWWSTGNPSFLIDLIYSREYSIPEVENYETTDEMLDSFDVDSISLEILLWQTGYLTIKDTFTELNRIKYRLCIPNWEVQFTLNDFLIDVLTKQKFEKVAYQSKMGSALLKADFDKLKETISTLFSSISYSNFTNNKIYKYEGYYSSVMYAYFASIGMEMIPEDTTNKGRIDLTLKYEDKVYVIEFKMSEKATGEALKQIKRKNYAEKYLDYPNIYLIGIEFSRKERNVVGLDWEKV